MAVRIYKSGKNTAFAGFAWAEQGRTRKYPVQTIEVSRKASGMSGTANRNADSIICYIVIINTLIS